MSLAAPALLTALDQRTYEAARTLGVLDDAAAEGHDASRILPLLVDRCRESASLQEVWLVMAAVTASFPKADDVRQLARAIRHQSTDRVVTDLMAQVVEFRYRGHPELEMDVVVEGVVVDVDYCAQHDYNSGIQRVVRRTLPRWRESGHEFVCTAWARGGHPARTLSPLEHDRVFAWRGRSAARRDRSFIPRMVLPWRSTVVLVEAPTGAPCVGLASLAELSGNALVCVGYDAIPIVNAELRAGPEIDAFALYLTMLKHARRVAGISETSAHEFRSFASTLGAQGLPGPTVAMVEIPGAAVNDDVDQPVARDDDTVHVLVPGAREPHKNQRTALHAAERLWREGLDFDVTLVGGKGWHSAEVDDYVKELAAAGRPVRQRGRVTDAELDESYRRADVAVFLSLQEGYGLPAAEALAVGTPVLTTSFGSLGEIAAGGGALATDPRHDDDVTDQLRRLVTDADLRARLGQEARARKTHSWDDYAADLWRTLVVGP